MVCEWVGLSHDVIKQAQITQTRGSAQTIFIVVRSVQCVKFTADTTWTQNVGYTTKNVVSGSSHFLLSANNTLSTTNITIAEPITTKNAIIKLMV